MHEQPHIYFIPRELPVPALSNNTQFKLDALVDDGHVVEVKHPASDGGQWEVSLFKPNDPGGNGRGFIGETIDDAIAHHHRALA